MGDMERLLFPGEPHRILLGFTDMAVPAILFDITFLKMPLMVSFSQWIRKS